MAWGGGGSIYIYVGCRLWHEAFPKLVLRGAASLRRHLGMLSFNYYIAEHDAIPCKSRTFLNRILFVVCASLPCSLLILPISRKTCGQRPRDNRARLRARVMQPICTYEVHIFLEVITYRPFTGPIASKYYLAVSGVITTSKVHRGEIPSMPLWSPSVRDIDISSIHMNVRRRRFTRLPYRQALI